MYWDYYYPETRRRPVKDGLKAKSTSGRIGKTWWSEKWIFALEHIAGFNSNRLPRGRSYARTGQIINFKYENKGISAKVHGSIPRPYNVRIELKQLAENDWQKIIKALSQKAIFAAKLLSGEMPKDIEEVFKEVKIPLFTTTVKDLKTSCSCPDSANPCKHTAAVYYILAEKFDEELFLIFELRGQSKEKLLDRLHELRASAADDKKEEIPFPKHADEPLENRITDFWKLGQGMDKLSFCYEIKESPGNLIKHIGEPPFWKDKNHSFVEMMEKFYNHISRKALNIVKQDSNY